VCEAAIKLPVISFYKPPTQSETLAAHAEAPLRPSKGQKPPPKGGLFGPG
jgi:hypothetical protein